MSVAAAKANAVPLRVLIVEDSEEDADLISLELKRGGFDPLCRRVARSDQMADALEQGAWDIVLSDFSLPEFSVAEALAMVQQAGLDIPFVIVSATIGEEAAAEAMKAGAHDCVFKDRLARLVPAIRRELKESAVRRERGKLEEQMRHAQKLESLGLLAGGVAHDFNNLLTGVLGNASLALEVVDAESKARPMLHAIVRATERTASLARQLLAYAGRGRFAIGPVDVSALVWDISELLRSSVPRTTELVLDLNRGLPPVEGDSSQIQQLVMNLILNAAEASGGRHGKVTVFTGVRQIRPAEPLGEFLPEPPAAGAYVEIAVRDDGCGMCDRTRAQIFDPFFTTKPAGRGLGLAAALGIVRGHGGAIGVSSTAGRGSTFTVLLPAFVADAPRQGDAGYAAVGPPPPQSFAGSVLVVDDEDVVRHAARAALEHFGYSVFEACDGQDAADLFTRLHDRISCVLLDLTMPRMDGRDVWRHIRRIRADVRVVISSGFDEDEARKHFGEAPGLEFLQKPYTATALARKVAAVTERRPKG
jgi:signal transduction histidine kinase